MKSTMTSRIKNVRANIPDHYRRCEICRSTFKCPKVLPCMHVFCLACLETCWQVDVELSDTSSERDSGLGFSGGTTSGRGRPLRVQILKHARRDSDTQHYMEPDRPPAKTTMGTMLSREDEDLYCRAGDLSEDTMTSSQRLESHMSESSLMSDTSNVSTSDSQSTKSMDEDSSGSVFRRKKRSLRDRVKRTLNVDKIRGAIAKEIKRKTKSPQQQHHRRIGSISGPKFKGSPPNFTVTMIPAGPSNPARDYNLSPDGFNTETDCQSVSSQSDGDETPPMAASDWSTLTRGRKMGTFPVRFTSPSKMATLPFQPTSPKSGSLARKAIIPQSVNVIIHRKIRKTTQNYMSMDGGTSTTYDLPSKSKRSVSVDELGSHPKLQPLTRSKTAPSRQSGGHTAMDGSTMESGNTSTDDTIAGHVTTSPVFTRQGSFLHGQASLIRTIEDKKRLDTPMSQSRNDEDMISSYASSDDIQRQPLPDQLPYANRPLPATPHLLDEDPNRKSLTVHLYEDPESLKRRSEDADTARSSYLSPVSVRTIASHTQISGTSTEDLNKIWLERREILQKKRMESTKCGEERYMHSYGFNQEGAYEPVGAEIEPASQDRKSAEPTYSVPQDLEAAWKQMNPSTPYKGKPKFFNPDALNCPFCKTCFELPVANQVTSLPDCYFLDGIAPVEHARPPCDVCACADNLAVVRCMECAKYLCMSCRETHIGDKIYQRHHLNELPALQSHKALVNYKSRNSRHCVEHYSRDTTTYCHTCCTWLCDECRESTRHRRHNLESMQSIKDRSENYLSSYGDNTRLVMSRHLQANATLDERLQDCDEEKNQQLSELATTFQKVNEVFFQAYLDLQGDIETHYEREKHDIADLKQQNTRMIRVINDVGQMSRLVCEGGRTTSVIGLIDTLTGHLQYLDRTEPANLEVKTSYVFTESETKTDKKVFKDLLGSIQMSQNEITPLDRTTKMATIRQIPRARNTPKELSEIRLSISSDSKGCAPNGISTDANANIYIVDEINRKVKVFSNRGKFISSIEPKGNYNLVDPCDIAVIDESTFAVSDRRQNVVLIIESEDGKVINTFEEMESAWGLCYHGDRGLFVADPSKGLVWLYEINGRIRYRYKAPRGLEMKYPQWVAVNSNGDLLVTDFEDHCFHIFTSTGLYLTKITEQPFMEPSVFHGIACRSNSDILLSDLENGCILEYTCNGVCKAILLSKDDGLNNPQGIAFDVNGYLLVLDGGYVKRFNVSEPKRGQPEVKEYESKRDQLAIQKDPEKHGKRKVESKNLPRETKTRSETIVDETKDSGNQNGQNRPSLRPKPPIEKHLSSLNRAEIKQRRTGASLLVAYDRDSFGQNEASGNEQMTRDHDSFNTHPNKVQVTDVSETSQAVNKMDETYTHSKKESITGSLNQDPLSAKWETNPVTTHNPATDGNDSDNQETVRASKNEKDENQQFPDQESSTKDVGSSLPYMERRRTLEQTETKSGKPTQKPALKEKPMIESLKPTEKANTVSPVVDERKVSSHSVIMTKSHSSDERQVQRSPKTVKRETSVKISKSKDSEQTDIQSLPKLSKSKTSQFENKKQSETMISQNEGRFETTQTVSSHGVVITKEKEPEYVQSSPKSVKKETSRFEKRQQTGSNNAPGARKIETERSVPSQSVVMAKSEEPSNDSEQTCDNSVSKMIKKEKIRVDKQKQEEAHTSQHVVKLETKQTISSQRLAFTKPQEKEQVIQRASTMAKKETSRSENEKQPEKNTSQNVGKILGRKDLSKNKTEATRTKKTETGPVKSQIRSTKEITKQFEKESTRLNQPEKETTRPKQIEKETLCSKTFKPESAPSGKSSSQIQSTQLCQNENETKEGDTEKCSKIEKDEISKLGQGDRVRAKTLDRTTALKKRKSCTESIIRTMGESAKNVYGELSLERRKAKLFGGMGTEISIKPDAKEPKAESTSTPESKDTYAKAGIPETKCDLKPSPRQDNPRLKTEDSGNRSRPETSPKTGSPRQRETVKSDIAKWATKK